jgi:hypothetical protein
VAVGVRPRQRALPAVRSGSVGVAAYASAFLRGAHAGLLLRQTVAALGRDPARHYTSAQVKRLLVGNPMRRLQLLLGHASEATVYTYLDVLDEAQEIVASALARWDEQTGALPAVLTAEGAEAQP